MGCQLLQQSPQFAAVLADLDQAMQPQAGFSILAELQAQPEQSRLDDTTVAQPLLFAIQVAVTQLLREQGIHPVAVAGHSVGEIAAAWASGALSLEQAIRVICARSQAQGMTRGCGRMAAVALSADALRKALQASGLEQRIEIAGFNSPANLTLTGSQDALQQLQAYCAHHEPGVFFRMLELDYGFHSRFMDPIEGSLTRHLADLVPSVPGQARFVSTVTGREITGAGLDAAYWWHNIRQPVRFAAAIEQLGALGCRVFVEIGPHAILQRYINETLAGADIAGRVLGTGRRHHDGLQPLLETVARVRLLADTDLAVWFPVPGQAVRLPNYPWQRQRHWHASTSESLQAIQRRRVHPLLGWRQPAAEASWENVLDPTLLPWLADHQVGGAIVYPGAAYAEMALAAGREWGAGQHTSLESLDILAPMVFDGDHARTLRLDIQPRDGSFRIRSRQRLSQDEWTLHALGRLIETSGYPARAQIVAPAPDHAATLDARAHYALATRLGLNYGPAFQGLHAAWLGPDATLQADVRLPAGLDTDGYLLHPGLLDLCFQSLVDFHHQAIAAGRGVALLPVRIGRLSHCAAGVPTHLRARIVRRSARSVLADFELFDDAGHLLAQLQACRFRAAPLNVGGAEPISHWRIEPRLLPHAAEARQAGLPTPTHLLACLDGALGQEAGGLEHEHRALGRAAWFKETLPLTEVLVLAFAFEACQQLGTRLSLLDSPQASPLAQWLAALLRQENLLLASGDGWVLSDAAELPAAAELWQTLLREHPAYLPHLALLGHWGRALPGVLAGERDAAALLAELQQSPIAESRYQDDPRYLGERLALEGLLAALAAQRPVTCQLRVLELSAAASELPKTLATSLPEDRWVYQLALPTLALQARQEAEYQDVPSVEVTRFDASAAHPVPETGAPFYDLIIFRHSLQGMLDPLAAVQQARSRLADGGVLVVAESHPDWAPQALEGLNPDWWLPGSDGPLAPLRHPAAWRALLDEAGLADSAIWREPAAESLAEGVFLVLGQRPADPAAQARVISHAAPSTWLLLADAASDACAQALQAALQAQGHAATLAQRLPTEGLQAFAHLVYLQDWATGVDGVVASSARLTHVAQALMALAAPARLWLVTQAQARQPAQAALWGLGRVLMNEALQLASTLIDLDALSAAEMPALLLRELLQPDGANEIWCHASGRYAPVMREATPVAEASGQPATAGGLATAATTRFRLDFQVPGKLRNARWFAADARPLQAHEIEVETQATGLNFRDVMYLMGLLPDEAVENGFAGASLGLEFSGIVRRVGAGVQDLQAGDAVMGFGASCFASHIVTRADAVAKIPASWTFEAAATVPTVFLTVYYAVHHLAALQPGERILIHGGAGGVGIAAIQLAHHLGAEIFATAGTDEKRDFVRLLGADHVLDSRSLDFADEIRQRTHGEGVDVVLNSLAGEAMRRSLDVLKPFGRFLELGKRDFFENTPLGLRPLRNNISYFGIDADQLLTGRPALAARLFKEVIELFHAQVLNPLPYRCFEADRVVDALRTMQQARHIGKIVVNLARARVQLAPAAHEQAAVALDPDGAWLVTGGLSGFGLESARWLAAHGVRHLVLVSRRGEQAPDAQAIRQTFSKQGVQVRIEACDVSQAVAVGALLERVRQGGVPLVGVLHAAAVFDDRLISRLDEASLARVLGAKLQGAWHLHQATLADPIRHFVLYGSVTTAIGNPGQGNYVAANAGLESLAALRRHTGLPASCLAWGPIGDVGYLTRQQAVKDSLQQRLGRVPLSAQHALSQLGQALQRDIGQDIVANFDWNVLARLLPSADSPRFAVLNRNRQDTGADVTDIRALIQGKSADEIVQIVQDLVRQEVAQTLAMAADRIDAQRSLHELGMDSLMAVELAMSLEQRFGVQLPAMMLNDAPTVAGVAARIIGKLNGSDANSDNGEQDVQLIASVADQHGSAFDAAQLQQIEADVQRLSVTGADLIS